jgi:hypothetical protein
LWLVGVEVVALDQVVIVAEVVELVVYLLQLDMQ